MTASINSREQVRAEALPRWIALGTAALALVVGTAAVVRGSSARPAEAGREAAVRAALAERLPKTKVDSVRCDQPGGLCEVLTGPTLFYTDASARYLIVGRIYDLEGRADLTAARLLELSPEMLLAGAPAARTPPASSPPEVSRKIDVATLPREGGIAWGNVSGPKVTVFSDLACGYCRQLHGELRKLGARVTEHPISVLGSRPIADAVWCSRDRAAALATVYRTGDRPTSADCDTSALDANEAFARSAGFTGTPVLVRSDGEVLVGYRPAAELRRWLAGRLVTGPVTSEAGS
jgi:thiol:disulfide interchange protein DsbC